MYFDQLCAVSGLPSKGEIPQSQFPFFLPLLTADCLFSSVQLRTVAFLEIKQLTAVDLPAVVELDQVCLGGLWTLEGYRRELESPNSDLLGVWTDRENHTPALIGIGCLWAILEEAHITVLGIHPQWQHQGLGQALLWALLKSACQRQLEWATLEVRETNSVALSLYQKFGFQEAGRRRRYYKDTGEDALILWCKGLQTLEFAQKLAVREVQIRQRLLQAGWQIPINSSQPSQE